MFNRNRCGNHSENRKQSFLARLRDNTSGNTLAIVGAALIPLTAMIGSGVDMSRAYMAKTRLQSACDAAALAGRRVMVNDSLGTNVQPEAIRYFNFNFPQGLYQTAAFTPTVTRPAAGTVRVAASTTIPTAVMRIFGFTTLPLSVDCDASLNFVNTDVMLVLDTTGSMDRDINNNSTNNDADRKITALRNAVMALYDELAPIQTQLQANGLRLRYGVVPYSSTVNVGALIRSVNASYLSDAVQYQTRVGDYDNYEVNRVISNNAVTQTYSNSISQAACELYAANASYPTLDGQPAPTGGPAPAPVTTVSYEPRDWGVTGDTDGTNRTCRRRKRTTITQTGWFANGGFNYMQDEVNTSTYKMGTPVTIVAEDNDADDDEYSGAAATEGDYDPQQAAGQVNGIETTTVTWNGCIEERATVNTITSASGYTIPSGAFDLDINLIPNNNATRWRPMWPSIVWRRDSSTSRTRMDGAPCPEPARRLQAWTRANLLTYVNSLDPGGNTYHDIGMIWGARMISSAGIFADSPDTFASMPVSRHIIFMTDGIMDTDHNGYNFMGVERNDQRVSGGNWGTNPVDGELDSRHMQRFRMVCNAAKQLNASIWVIAFGADMTLQQHLVDCASNANQASLASNQAQLIARFREIGSNIGALRLTN